jgi:outer membrane receptor protein involved in Fe transport
MLNRKITSIRNVVAVALLAFFAGFCETTAAAPVRAGTGKISGIITNENGEPLAYANIIIPSLGTGTVSARDGSFTLLDVRPGKYLVTVTYVGYESKSMEIRVVDGGESTLDFRLKSTLFELEPIVVTGSPVASDPLRSPQEIRSVGGRDKLRFQSASLGATIERVPGITSMSTGGVAGKPVIRGHTGERIRILVDGVSQEYQQYGERHAPNIDPFNYERIEIIKGASSLLYGSDAIGGAVNLIPLSPRFAASSNSFIGGMLMGKWSSVDDCMTAGLRLRGGTGSLGFHGSFAARRSGGFSTPDVPTYAESGVRGDPKFTGDIDHTDYEQYTGSFAAGYMFGAGIVTASWDHWWNENNYLLPTGGPIGLGLENRIASIKGFFPVGAIVVRPGISYQRNSRRATNPGIPREFLPDSARVDLELNVYTIRVDVEHRGTGALAGTVGAEVRYYDHENLGSVPLQPTGHYTDAAFYIFEELALEKHTINAGLRLNYRSQKFQASETNPLLPADDEIDYFNVASSLGASRRIGEHLTAVANINQGFRIPSFFNSYVYGQHGGVFAFQIGKPDLEPELSFDFSIGLRLATQKIGGSITGYIDYIRNYIYLYDAPDHPLAPPPSEYEFVFAHDQEDARIAGLDIDTELEPLEWLHLGGNLSLIASEFLAGPHEGRELPLMPTAKAGGYLRFMLPDRGAVRNSNIRLELRYAAGRDAAGPYEPFAQFDDGIGPDIPFGTASTESYLLLNSGIGFDVDLGDAEFNIDMELTNLTNEAYRDFLDTYKGYTLGLGRGINVTVNVPLCYK